MGRKVRKLKMGLAALILCGSLLPPACAKGEVPRELSQLYAHSAVLMAVSYTHLTLPTT